MDNAHLLEVLEYRKSSKANRPLGVRTALGWAFMGPDPWGENEAEGEAESPQPKATYKTTRASQELTDLVNRQFEIENIGALEEPPPYSPGVTAGPKDPSTWTPVERLADSLMVV